MRDLLYVTAIAIAAIFSAIAWWITKLLFKTNRIIWFWVVLGILWYLISSLYLRFVEHSYALSRLLLPMFIINCIIYFACIAGFVIFVVRRAITAGN
jgi:hypothetical protein